MWQRICEDLEDCRAATLVTSIDFAEAFNRLSFQHCLSAFARKGASSPVIRLLGTFLSNRTMAVRVGTTWSERRHVTGGCPQGPILGVFLFNVTTDDLEHDFLRSERAEVPEDDYDILLDGEASWRFNPPPDPGPEAGQGHLRPEAAADSRLPQLCPLYARTLLTP